MKRTIIISLLSLCASTFCFSQNSFYSEGIGFEYNKKSSVYQTNKNGITYISSFNIVITKSKIKKDVQVNVEKIVEKWADELEEYCYREKLKIKNRSEITDRTIGTTEIKTKSIDFEYGKKDVERLYAFVQEDYLITIRVTGTLNSDINMILNSFWFMPENN